MILAREETSRRAGDSVGTAVGVSSSWKHPVGPGVLVAGGGRVAGGRGGRVAGGRGGSGADHGRGGVAHSLLARPSRPLSPDGRRLGV